jgi:hypothetical protein
MKKVLLSLAIIATLGAKAQTSIGTVGGLTLTKESKYYNTALYGVWVDLGKFGFQYSTSGSLNGSQSDMQNYINGRSKEFNAGIVSQNYGMFVSLKKGLYIGAGAQSSRYYNAEVKRTSISIPYTITERIGNGFGTRSGFTTEYIETPVVALRDKVTPYGVVGIKYDLGISFVGRAEVMISKVSSINVGIGIKIK